MNTYKITHTKLIPSDIDPTKKVYDSTHYTIVHAETEDDALAKVKPEIILHIEDRGKQKEDIFNHWWEAWSNKIQTKRKDLQHDIRQIKSPSKKVKK